ncbi:hypothetical protein FisN_1Lh440 [Fistulifera solaris]|uniref:Uncharacterized protein n=1 Tax=Fistulifera solaris TaxID=1519565 RepID=A0A1Z5K3W9_FISSO|nr:hypothetical protein FisN_1Lh440 [Fistulifera solaris]|eukprot:GAX20906.1 hypothetical protein FisN_1Lh440 [Fistulifera solaris]
MKKVLLHLWVSMSLFVIPSTAFRPQSLTVTRRITSTSSTILCAVAENSSDDLKTGYKLGSYMLAATGAFLLSMPDRTGRTLVASKVGGATGYGLAAGLCYILEGAYDNNRLGSDTYKRLNLGLFAFMVLGLFAIPGEAGFLPSAVGAMIMSVLLTVVRLYGVALAWKGWEYGVGAGSLKGLWDEIVNGTKETVKGLRVKNQRKALTYRNMLFLILMGSISSFFDGIFLLRYLKEFGKSLFEVSLKVSAVGRLLMITTMVYSLKDAAERDRLTGTTFIQLNLLVGTWAVFVGLGQAAFPYGFAANRGVEMFAIGLPFLIKAFKSQKEKLEKESSKEENPFER